jgi:hypothetical protein
VDTSTSVFLVLPGSLWQSLGLTIELAERAAARKSPTPKSKRPKTPL